MSNVIKFIEVARWTPSPTTAERLCIEVKEPGLGYKVGSVLIIAPEAVQGAGDKIGVRRINNGHVRYDLLTASEVANGRAVAFEALNLADGEEVENVGKMTGYTEDWERSAI